MNFDTAWEKEGKGTKTTFFVTSLLTISSNFNYLYNIFML